jgi:hypothetical protein
MRRSRHQQMNVNGRTTDDRRPTTDHGCHPHAVVCRPSSVVYLRKRLSILEE